MATIDGSIQLVKVVTDAELRQNGGSFVIAGRMAQPIQGFDTLTRRASGGNAIPVYVVSDAQIANGTFRLKGGSALPMADIDVVGAGIKTIQGAAIPVYVVSGTLGAGGAAVPTLEEQMLALPGVISYFPVTDTSGTTVVNATGDTAFDGTYINTPTLASVAFPGGDNVAAFDGINQGVNIYSAAFASAFNGAKGWAIFWFKCSNPAAASGFVANLYVDASNMLYVNNKGEDFFRSYYRASATVEFSDLYHPGTSQWHMVALDWDKAGEQTRHWWDGVLVTTSTALGVWVGAIDPEYAMLAAQRNTGAGAFLGSVAHAAIGAGQVLTTSLVQTIYEAVITSPFDMTFGGDSKTAGDAWCGLVVGSIANATGDNWRENPVRFAVAGYTVAQLHALIDANAPSALGNPSIACINIGVNDAGALPTEAAWKADLVGCIDGLRAKWPTIQVYISRIWMRSQPANCATINGWIDDVIATQAYIHAGPDESVWLENGDDGVTYTSDGTHYNAAGNVEAANQWMTALGY